MKVHSKIAAANKSDSITKKRHDRWYIMPFLVFVKVFTNLFIVSSYCPPRRFISATLIRLNRRANFHEFIQKVEPKRCAQGARRDIWWQIRSARIISIVYFSSEPNRIKLLWWFCKPHGNNRWSNTFRRRLWFEMIGYTHPTKNHGEICIPPHTIPIICLRNFDPILHA